MNSMDIEISKSDVSPELWQKLLVGCRLKPISSVIASIDIISYSRKIPAAKLEILNQKPNWSIDQIVNALPDYEEFIREKLSAHPNWTAQQALDKLK